MTHTRPGKSINVAHVNENGPQMNAQSTRSKFCNENVVENQPAHRPGTFAEPHARFAQLQVECCVCMRCVLLQTRVCVTQVAFRD